MRVVVHEQMKANANLLRKTEHPWAFGKDGKVNWLRYPPTYLDRITNAEFSS